MIIWSGVGFIAALITFFVCCCCELLFDYCFGVGYYSSHGWTVGVALVVGGAITARIGYAIRSEESQLDNGSLGEHAEPGGTFFFLPLPSAGLAIASIGVVVIAYDVVLQIL